MPLTPPYLPSAFVYRAASQINLLDLGRPADFLAKAVNPPEPQAINNSLEYLRGLRALDPEDDDRLTALGYHLATLPVDPRIGKMMLFGCIFRCVEPVLTIAASMSFKNPFLSPFDKRDEADMVKKGFAVHSSDHLTCLKAYDGWQAAKRGGFRAERGYCFDNFLSRNTLMMISEMRRQFWNLLCDIGFLSKKKTSTLQSDPNEYGDNLHLVKAVVTAGLYPNVLALPKDNWPPKEGAEMKFESRKGSVALHPCSVNFGSTTLDSRYLVYHEMVKTSQVYVRDCSTVSPYILLLFGGQLDVHHQEMLITVDRWLAFNAPPKVAVLVKLLRREMETLLRRKIQDPEHNMARTGSRLVHAISQLLQSDALSMARESSRVRVEQKALAKAAKAGRGRGGRGGRDGRGGRNGHGGNSKRGEERPPESAEASIFVPGHGSYVASQATFSNASVQPSMLMMGASPYVPSVAQDGSEQDDDRRGRRGKGGRGGRRGRR